MTEYLLSNAQTIRMAIFVFSFIMIAVMEVYFPRRKLTVSKTERWLTNLGLIVLFSVLLRIIFPMMVIGLAANAEKACIGVFNVWKWPFVLRVIAGVIILDCAVYFQHVLFHYVPTLWRLHKVHHTDLDFDLSTGIRFHPLEMILSIGVKMSVVIVFGLPVVAVFIFELILNSSAMFTHSNCRLPIALDRGLRWLMVTPDMHRIHHSVHHNETNRNFGFFISFWDRFFGTYLERPHDGHRKMKIGLNDYQEPKQLRFVKLLILPFLKSPNHLKK